MKTLFTKLDREWAVAAIKRAIRTFAQTLLAGFGAAGVFEEVDWKKVLLASAFAFVVSVLMSLKGLPETTAVGELKIDTTDPNKDNYLFEVGDLDSLATKKSVMLRVSKK